MIPGDGKPHLFVLEMIAGNGKVRPTLGETTVVYCEPRKDHDAFIVKLPGIHRLFDTHPPLDERIALLREL